MTLSSKYIILFYSLSVLCTSSGCRDQEREQQLILREQQLLEREKQFALKEADYQSLLTMRDSILSAQKDTILPLAWPDHIVGSWNSKMVCTQSSCNDYVVGDQRNDIWEFAGDSTGIYTRIIKNKKLVRVFNGSFDSTTIYLRFQSDTAANRMVTTDIILSQVEPGNMKGVQTTTVNQNCTAKFSVILTRSSNE